MFLNAEEVASLLNKSRATIFRIKGNELKDFDTSTIREYLINIGIEIGKESMIKQLREDGWLRRARNGIWFIRTKYLKYRYKAR